MAKGRKVDGWVVLDKPAGISSAAAVNRVKWAFQAQKAGHSGTLDPAATGVLAIALGEATKTIPVLEDVQKAYRFVVRWGQATNTDDAEGEVIATSDSRPDADAIRAALTGFVGDIQQVPPQYSAVKVGGERAYALARAGEAVELASRPLRVESLVLVDQPDTDHAVLEMVCGKGGYVRAIARDLGAVLGCLGHVVTLRRLWTGPFSLDQAHGLERFQDRSPDLDGLLLPVKAALGGLVELTCSNAEAALLKNGRAVRLGGREGDAWVSCGGEPVAIGVVLGGEFRPGRVFVG
jgi:tRNA pseudouridine55 synthase